MQAWNAEPSARAVQPSLVVLLLPAMGVADTYYLRFVERLAAEGIGASQVSFAERRDRPAADDAADGYKELVERRIPAAYAEAQRKSRDGRVLVVGHSLGGQLGLIAAGRYFPDAPVVLLASGTAHHKAFRGARGLAYLAASQTMALTARLLGYWPGDRLGFAGKQSTATMRDWAYNVRTGGYRSEGASFDYDEALREYRGPVHTIHVEGDRLAPPNATHQLLSKTQYEARASTVYASSRGHARPGSHFTWARDLPGVAPQIAVWAAQLNSETA